MLSLRYKFKDLQTKLRLLDKVYEMSIIFFFVDDHVSCPKMPNGFMLNLASQIYLDFWGTLHRQEYQEYHSVVERDTV